MSFRFSSSSASSSRAPSSSGSSRPIKSPKHIQSHASCPQQQFNVPNGPNWVYASGGSRAVRFDFTKALDEQIASEDGEFPAYNYRGKVQWRQLIPVLETCGSSQEYYARKSASSHPKPASKFVPPVLQAYKTDPRFLYPTQRPNYAFNFDRATPSACTQKFNGNASPY